MHVCPYMRAHLCVSLSVLLSEAGVCVCFWAGSDRIPTSVHQDKQVSLLQRLKCCLQRHKHTHMRGGIPELATLT